MDRRRAISAGTVLFGIALTANSLLQGDVAPPAMAAPEAGAERPLAAPLPARPVPAPQTQTMAARPAKDPAPPFAASLPDATAEACKPQLDLMPEPEAMIGVTILAPCHADERIVLMHGGMTITLRSTATGSVFTTIPSLSAEAKVTARWGDGTEATAILSQPDTAPVDRFVLQFPAEVALTLPAYAPGAAYGGPGHVLPVALADLPLGASLAGTVLALGDAGVSQPLLSYVYTYPDANRATLSIEAPVTAETCNRELLGETIEIRGGVSSLADLTLSMPDCGAIGEFLVLNIAPGELTLAQAE